MKCSMILAVALGLAAATPVMAQGNLSQGLSQASMASVAASGLVVQGSLAGVEASGQFVVASVQVVGESTVIVLRGVSTAAEASVQVASKLAEDLAISAGTAVLVVAELAGYALLAKGKLIAFVPNQVGKSMLHQTRVR